MTACATFSSGINGLTVILVDPKTGGNMDPLLREMCINVIRDEVNGEKFTNLLIESGMELDDVEWKIAARLLGEIDRVMYIKETHASPALLQ